MLPLPLKDRKLERFEDLLVRTWLSKRSSYAEVRDALAIGLGLAGLRWEEVSRLRRRDLGMASCSIRVHTAKGGVNRTLYMGASWRAGVWHLMNRWMGQLEALEFVFRTKGGGRLGYEQVRRRMQVWSRKCFGEEYSFHSLRHTAALRLYYATHDVVAVQRMLGHRSLAWTSVYLRSVQPVVGPGLPGFARPGVGLRLFDPDGFVAAGGGR